MQADICQYFYAPALKDLGYIILLVSVCLYACPSVQNLT